MNTVLSLFLQLVVFLVVIVLVVSLAFEQGLYGGMKAMCGGGELYEEGGVVVCRDYSLVGSSSFFLFNGSEVRLS